VLRALTADSTVAPQAPGDLPLTVASELAERFRRDVVVDAPEGGAAIADDDRGGLPIEIGLALPGKRATILEYTAFR
jgi:hypothetical protein